MNTHQTLSIFFVIVFSLTGFFVKAQDIKIDIKKPEKTYSTDFAKTFKVSFSNATAEKATVTVKVKELAFIVKRDADLKTFSVTFTPATGNKLSFTDKDNKKQNIAADKFDLQFGDTIATILPGKANADLIVDLAGKDSVIHSFANPFSVTFKGTDANTKDLLITDGDRTLTLKSQDLTKTKISFFLKDGDLFIDDGSGKPKNADDNKPFKVDDKDFQFVLGNKKITVVDTSIVQPAVTPPNPVSNTCSPFSIIDASMFASVSMGGCQLCDIRSKPDTIRSKDDRKYSTDYIVIYDPLLKKDAYTICKHVIRKNKNPGKKPGENLIERYIKVRPKMFAPHVGSQIRFEVVNLPLNSTMRLSVDEQDVFNGGAAQFTNIINSLVTANIVSPITDPGGTAKTDEGDGTTAQGGDTKKCFLNNLDQLSSDVLKYMTTFRLSSCAVEKHLENLPVIFKRISDAFGISAATADQLYAQLSYKIDKDVADDKKVDAMKLVQLITNALKSMEDVKPLAFTTLRAKNRDYIEIKYVDGAGTTSKPENIRMSGGMKIDFSAGFVLTGLNDHSYVLKNIQYNYTPPGLDARDTTGNVIVKEDEGGSQVGVGLLTHFYPRMSSHYNFGGTVGLMTSTNLNLRLMLGGSVMISSLFGSNNRVSFSGGVVWGKVKRISEKDKDYFNQPRVVNGIPEFYSGSAAPEPIDRTSRSWFFAITMNFGGH